MPTALNHIRNLTPPALLLAWLVLSGAGCTQQQSYRSHIPDSAPVALVNGRAVLYEDVKVNSEKIEELYQRRKGHAPHDQDDWTQVSEMQLVAERENLIEVIRNIVQEQEYADWGIMVDEEQIEKEIENRATRTGLSELEARYMIDRQIQQTEDLITAINAVHEDEMSLEEARREYLSDYDEITSDYWAEYYAQRPPDQQVKVLRRAQAKLRTEGTGAFLRPLVERDLRGEQVQRRLHEELAKVFPNFKQVAVDARHGSSAAQERLAAMRTQWWAQRYEDAQVEILHPRFQGDWEAFVNDRASQALE
ncbi:MAG TPA: hypothetical protein VLV83_25445 [Acidobacteriota bacterium]|nr:hypothetical protein [Acidobacteriota bacterium]